MTKDEAAKLIKTTDEFGADKLLRKHLDQTGTAFNHVLVRARFESAGIDGNGWIVIAIHKPSITIESVTGSVSSRSILVIRNDTVDTTSNWSASQASEGVYAGVWIVSSS
jgi:hypothetical protein